MKYKTNEILAGVYTSIFISKEIKFYNNEIVRFCFVAQNLIRDG